MPSLAVVKRGLRRLPFMEMMSLSTDVTRGIEELKGPRNVEKLAQIMATLPMSPGEDLEREQRALAKFFNRKRNISICTMQGGKWKITMGGNTPTIITNNIRDGIIEFLEALATLQALEED